MAWTLQWMNSKAEIFPFDGRGLTLARGTYRKGVSFDLSEVWRLYSTRKERPAGQNEFYILPVAIHEIGHVLGLEHSPLFTDVMVRNLKKLCDNSHIMY